MNTITVLRPLALPAYRRLFAAMVLAIFGQGAWALYLAMQTLSLGASPAQLAGVVAWSGIGLLACALPAGVVADRFEKRTILLTIAAANTAVASVTTLLAFAQEASFWLLGLSAFLIGASTAFFFPTYTALIPTMVDEAHLMAVNGLEGATRPLIGQAAAPALIGAVIGASLPPFGGLFIAVAYAAALLCVLGLPQGGSAVSQTTSHPLKDLVDGFRYVAVTPWIALSVAFASLMTMLVVGPLEVLLPALLRDGHANGAAIYGAVLAALGCGGLVGSLLMGSVPSPRRFLPAMITLWAAGCVPFALVGMTLNPWILGAGLFVYGALIGAGMVIWGTALQERVPLDMLGRVASLDFFISIAFMPISIAATGLLVQWVGTQTLFLAAGLGPALIAVPVLIVSTFGIAREKRR